MFNWQTATYGKIYCDDLDFFTDFESDYPAVVYDDALTSNENVLPEPTVMAGDGVAGIKQRRHDVSSDGVRNFATASGRGRLKEDLEPSTWRRRKHKQDSSIPIDLSTIFAFTRKPRKSSGQVVWSGGQDMKSGGQGFARVQAAYKEVMKMLRKVVGKVVHHGGERVVAWF
ncbi:hypothetical protein Tco_0016610 [Tanacetum coccineum]